MNVIKIEPNKNIQPSLSTTNK